MGKDSFGLPVPHDSTVALIRNLGGPEGHASSTAPPPPDH
jgi:hypothetical protein